MAAEHGESASWKKAGAGGRPPERYSTLGEFLADGGHYFKGQALKNGITYASPIQLECQSNFVILVSDGLQNGNVPGNGDVRTEATNHYSNTSTNDHSATFAGTQKVIVHTVGFDLAGDAAANDVLQTAATNGG